MAKIQLTTDGTIEGTNLIVDGADVTASKKIVSIFTTMEAPYVSRYDKTQQPGRVYCTYEFINDSNVVEKTTICTCDTEYTCGIGPKIEIGEGEIESEDSVKQFIGKPINDEVISLVDKITAFAEKEKIFIPSKEILLKRSVASLKDKVLDMKIEG